MLFLQKVRKEPFTSLKIHRLATYFSSKIGKHYFCTKSAIYNQHGECVGNLNKKLCETEIIRPTERT
jgi:hypothetical protein